MTDRDPGSHLTFENLKKIEAKLFKGDRGARAAGAGRPEDAGAGRDTWRLNQEVLDAKKECASLKYELDAVRLLLTEQNVFTVSSISALNELKKDFNALRRLFDESEAELAGLSPEISRLNSELSMEKRRSFEIGKNLQREAALREDLEKLLPEAARNGEPAAQAQGREPDLRDKFTALSRFRREERPRRYPRGY